MRFDDISSQRLVNQHIAVQQHTTVEKLVSYLVAVQSQEWALAKWAIGLRLPGSTDAGVEKAFNEGKILRTHLMRPTWHFVAPADIRWLLQLTAPRVHALNAFYYRQQGVDEKLLKRCHKIIEKVLEGHKHLTRAQLNAELEKNKITVSNLGMTLICMRAELEGLICSGPRAGKQFTYALLEERVAPAKPLKRDEALSELSCRYYATRGPATLKDFVWWSGLTQADAKAGAETLGKEFIKEKIEGQEYIFIPANADKVKKNSTFLMPDYDEYGISYKDRSALFDPAKVKGEKRNGNPVFNHMLVIDGVIAGTWKAITKGKSLDVEISTFSPINKTQQKAVEKAVKRYKEFYIK